MITLFYLTIFFDKLFEFKINNIYTFLFSFKKKPHKTKIKVENLIAHLFPMRIEKNVDAIITLIKESIEVRSKSGQHNTHLLLHSTELSLTSYDCGDLFQIAPTFFNQRIEKALMSLQKETVNHVSLTIGFPYYTNDKERVILHALIKNGKIVSIKGKEELANNIGRCRGVEYETRFFVPCKAGTQIKMFNQNYLYKVGAEAAGHIFSDAAIQIEQEKVSMVICEEMFIGTDQLNSLDKDLEGILNDYLKTTLCAHAIATHRMTHDQYCAFKLQLQSFLLLEDKAPLSFSGNLKKSFDQKTIQSLDKRLNETFADFKEDYFQMKSEGENEVKNEIRKKNKLYQQLKCSDVVLIPNGSPSATGKYHTRERLLKLIGETYQSDMNENEILKRIFYNNSFGTPGGSVSFDGTVMCAEVSKEVVKVRHLSSYHYGRIPEDHVSSPHWTKPSGQQAIIEAINETEYYSGKQRLNIAFGDETKHVYPKFYQETSYAYSNLLKHLENFSTLVKGKMLPRGNKNYWGYFISLSGGFDSAHTIIVRSKAIELRMRSLIKETTSIDKALKTIIEELKLNHREFDLNMFCSRFLTQQVNDSGDVTNQKLSDKNLQTLCKGVDFFSIISSDDAGQKIEEMKSLLKKENIQTIGDCLRVLWHQLKKIPQEELIHFLSKATIFHTVKAAYLRTDNNSIQTEQAARLLAAELGADFEVRNVDMDFKIALLIEKGIDLNEYEENLRIAILEKYGEILAIGKKSDRLEEIEQLLARIQVIQDARYSHQFNITKDEIEDQIALIQKTIDRDTLAIKRLKIELFQLINTNADLSTHAQQQTVLDSFKVHNWFESLSGLEIENIQARVRAAKNWEIASQYGLIPTSNPNTDEAKQGYTTYLGDLHAGIESSTADLRKIEILAEMALLMKIGLHDETQFDGKIEPIQSIYHTFTHPPSAELQLVGDAHFSQQTDEDSYGMSYFELSLIGDKLFELSNNGAQFISMREVFERLEDHPLFHGHHQWQIFSKIDQVYRQWFFATFKRRAAPWQMTNSDVSVDHHVNNRTEFSGFDNAIRYERADLLLTLLIKEEILSGDLNTLRKNLLINPQFQEKLQSIIWSNQDPKDLKVLIKRFADFPQLLNDLIRKRVGVMDPSIYNVKEPALLSGEMILPKAEKEIVGIPIDLKARDIAGNLYQAKKAVLKGYKAGHRIVVIPDIIGADLGDNLRRVSQKHIDVMLEELARFACDLSSDLALIVGHPTFDNTTEDRSCRYYQSGSIIHNHTIVKTFHATTISNNGDMPGPNYDRRTFQPKETLQETVTLNGKTYYVLIGDSTLPQELTGKSVQVIHIGSMEASSQLKAVKKIDPSLFSISVNAVGNPAGIQVFNGRVIEVGDDIRDFEEEDQLPAAIIKRDARWVHDYLPLSGKITMSLDSPESLYTLAVMKKRIEMKLKKPCDSIDFNAHVDVVAAHFSDEKDVVETLYDAANEVLGFDLPRSDANHHTNLYEIDTFQSLFLRNALVGDLNLNAFTDIEEEDTWLAFDSKLKEVLKKRKTVTKEALNDLKELLRTSDAFQKSQKQTWEREKKSCFESLISFDVYINMQIDLIMDRIRDYVPLVETQERLRAVFTWLLSARDGGEGQILFNNIARNDLCCSRQNLFGGRLHAGAVGLGASLSLKEMMEAILQGNQKPTIRALFEEKMNEEMVPGLKRREVDAIFEFIKDHQFDIRTILESDLFNEEKTLKPKMGKLETFITLWEKNIWDRHAIPNGPHTKYSIDQQTSFREPLRGSWLSDQLLELKKIFKHDL
ncbi:MAG: hypothetical protein ACH350_02195 [Parachlamydiaceae bacterium]